MNYYNDYLHSEHWSKTKEFLQYIVKKECYVCDKKDDLNTHHLSYKTINYEDGDELIFLCRKHHIQLHFFGGEKTKKRPFETDIDLLHACSKLISMRMLNKKKLNSNKDIVLAYQNYLRKKIHKVF